MMKRSAIGFGLIGLFFLVSNLTFAQDSDQSSSPTDEIVIKSTNLIMSEITANMKLTQDQIGAVRLIIEDNVVKVRELQLSLQKGSIDSKTMVSQRDQLTNDENQKLSRILTSDQMRAWLNILQDS